MKKHDLAPDLQFPQSDIAIMHLIDEVAVNL